MTELTPHQKTALGLLKLSWEAQQVAADRAAQRSENFRAATLNKERGITSDDHPDVEEAAVLPTFRERGDVDEAFKRGMEAVLRYDQLGTITDADGTRHTIVLPRPDAEALGAKLATLRAALSAEALPLWDELFGPPA